jgi:putative transposase
LDPVAAFQFVEREKAIYSVTRLCHILGVSTSGYYAWRTRKPSDRDVANAALADTIVEIHKASRGTYGSPRIHEELTKGMNLTCSKNRVARLMRQIGIRGVHRRHLRGTTRRDESQEPSPDLVNRQFMPEAPNQLWVADMTEHSTAEGKVYLAVVIDAFSRKVVGWCMGEHPTADLAIGAVKMAIWNRRPKPGLIHHSDHGSQYTSTEFRRVLQESGIVSSMGTVGDALDNAVAESFFATLQTELLDRHTWPTRRSLKAAIFEFIEAFYNRRRRHSTLEYLSPNDCERRWFTSHQMSEQSAA